MQVVIYTKANCDSCVKGKSWLSENGLSGFEERHMEDKSVQQEMVTLGYTIYHRTKKDEVIGCGAVTVDGIMMTLTTLNELVKDIQPFRKIATTYFPGVYFQKEQYYNGKLD